MGYWPWLYRAVYNFITDNSCLSLVPIFSAPLGLLSLGMLLESWKRFVLSKGWIMGMRSTDDFPPKEPGSILPPVLFIMAWVPDRLHSIEVNESNLLVKFCFDVLLVKLALFFCVNTLWASYTKDLRMQKCTQLWLYAQTNDKADWLSRNKCCVGHYNKIVHTVHLACSL